MNQAQKVLTHLQNSDHLTPLEALGLYGIYRLAARIHDLRSAGYRISNQVGQDGTGRPYSRYQLVS